MERALILSADRWEMADEKTGELRSGVSVWFINDYREDTGKAVGFKPTKVNADPSMFNALASTRLPALFDLAFGSRPGAQGKATLTLTGMTHVKDVDVFAVGKKAA